MRNSLFRRTVVFFGLIILFVANAGATTITSRGGSGNWNDTAHWTPAQVPVAGDSVIVTSSNPITVNVTAAAQSINVLSSATLTINAALTLTKTLQVNGTCSETTIYWLTMNGSNMHMKGSGTFSISCYLSVTGSLTIDSGTSVNLVSGGTYLYGTGTSVTNNGTFITGYGSVNAITFSSTGQSWTQGTNSYLKAGYGIVNTGSFDASASGNTVEYGAYNYIIRTPSTSYQNLILNGTRINTWTLSGNITINGDMTVEGSAYLDGSSGYTISLKGNWNDYTTFWDLRSVNVTFIGSGSQFITKSSSWIYFHNFTLSGTGTVYCGSTTVETDNVIINSGTLDYYSATLFVVYDNWTNNGGTFVPHTGTMEFATQVSCSVSKPGGKETFYNVTKYDAGTLSLGSSIQIAGSLTIYNDTLKYGSIADTVFIAGNWTNSGGVFTPGNLVTVDFNGTSLQQVTKTSGTETFYNVLTTGSSNLTSFNCPTTCSGNLTIGAGTSATMYSLGVTGNISISSGATFNTSYYVCPLTLGGNWTNYGTYTGGTGWLTLSGTGTQTLVKYSGGSVAVETFHKVKINKPGLFQLNGPMTVSDSLKLTKAQIVTTSTNILKLNNGTVLQGGSDSAYVSGPMDKVGNSAFTFPLGSTTFTKGAYHPLGISAPSNTTDEYVAQYTPSGQTYGTTLDTSLKSVNTSEYWTLNRSAGTSNVQVTLSWNRNSTNGNGYNDFKVGFWNGSKWISQGQASHFVSGQLGTLTSSTAVSFSGGSTTAPLVVGNSQAFSPCGVTDANYNWTMEEVLDVNGNDLKVTKVFTDQLGREIQTLRSDNTDNLVIATATAYDAYGRPAVKTLPAPACNSYLYKDGFFNASSGTVYDYTHFDQTSTLNNPDAVQSTFGNGLGNFYSNNGIDTYVATSSYPYARTEYTADPFSSVKRSAIAGDEYKMGTGHESRGYSMISGDELRFIFGHNGSSVPYSYKSSINSSDRSINTSLAISSGILAEKTVNKNADGQEMISYSVGGKVIASCYSGLSTACTMTTITNILSFAGTLSTDIHLPYANKGSLKFPICQFLKDSGIYVVHINIADSLVLFKITDLNTNYVLVLGTDYTFNTSTRAITLIGSTYGSLVSSFVFRISCSFKPSVYTQLVINGWTMSDPKVTYDEDYTKWSVNYYDLAGQLRKSVSPGGINCSSAGTINFATTYDYDTEFKLILSKSPDEGKKEIIYDDEGKVRFSQNATQLSANKFSYVDYDINGRPVEKGECSPIAGGIYFQDFYSLPSSSPFSGGVASSTVLDNTGTFSGSFAEQFFTDYYKLASGDKIPNTYSYYTQYIDKEFMGKPSKTWNDQTSTWYCYDKAGRLMSVVTQLKDADYTGSGNTTTINSQIKTLDYTYDNYTGLVTGKVYQTNQTSSPDEKLTHTFTYDPDYRLQNVQVATSNGIQQQEAKYAYYITGGLKRKELGVNVQGVDYVYTINGQLKSINHPSLGVSKDPGMDGVAGTNVNFAADIFAMSLDYHQNDYTRTGSNVLSSCGAGAGYYSGLVSAFRWKERSVTNSVNNGADYLDYGGTDQSLLLTDSTTELMNKYTYDERNRLSQVNFGIFNNGSSTFTVRTNNDYEEGYSGAGSISYDDNGNITHLKRNGYYQGGISSALMDDISYTYTSNTNTLASVSDAVTGINWGDFNTNTTGTTFSYDGNGRMTTDNPEQVSTVAYNSLNKTSKVTFSFANSSYAEYWYDDAGRKYKTKYTDRTNLSAIVYKITWYMYEGNNVVAEYDENTSVNTNVTLNDQPIYGAGRIGVFHRGTTVVDYELTDHLGNVRATIKYAGLSGTRTIAQVTTMSDYYAFGGVMPGRTYVDANGSYRFNYQGQEAAVNQKWKMFELRMLSPDLGRWLSPDPKGQFYSPYISMANNPVTGTDPDGGFVNLNSNGSFCLPGRAQAFGSYAQYYSDVILPDYYSLSRYQDAYNALIDEFDMGKTSSSSPYYTFEQNNALWDLQSKFGMAHSSSGGTVGGYDDFAGTYGNGASPLANDMRTKFGSDSHGNINWGDVGGGYGGVNADGSIRSMAQDYLTFNRFDADRKAANKFIMPKLTSSSDAAFAQAMKDHQAISDAIEKSAYQNHSLDILAYPVMAIGGTLAAPEIFLGVCVGGIIVYLSHEFLQPQGPFTAHTEDNSDKEKGIKGFDPEEIPEVGGALGLGSALFLMGELIMNNRDFYDDLQESNGEKQDNTKYAPQVPDFVKYPK